MARPRGARYAYDSIDCDCGIAIGEFGPRSLIYHEGRAYRVVKVQLGRAARLREEGRLETSAIHLCPACGAGHRSEPPERCHVCREVLAGGPIVRDVFRIDNVSTRLAERITANDEERQRQGFDLQTTFSFARSTTWLDGEVLLGEDLVARLSYAGSATLRRLNKGLRRRRNQSVNGFEIDPRTGYWRKSEDEGEDGDDGPISARQSVVPMVEDHKNVLLLRLVTRVADEGLMATVQHALLRGIQTLFQLEEGELLAEPTPGRDNRRAILFYEAAEGGAGVLSRLAEEPDALARVAREALALMHYDIAPLSSEPGLSRAHWRLLTKH
jgi:hypothetical protein